MVFSIVVSRLRLPALFPVGLARLRLCFYTKIRRQSFHAAWVINGSGPVGSAFRSTLNSRHRQAAQPCPKGARKRLMHCNKSVFTRSPCLLEQQAFRANNTRYARGGSGS